jgi:integrase/recombinase XerD
MPVKVNLKKYLAHDGKWQFFPVLKINGKPRPEVVLINGEPVKSTKGKFYLEYRQDGKRVQRPCGSTPREALDEWRKQQAIFDGIIEAPEEETTPLPLNHVSVASAVGTFLHQVLATKTPGTYDAYRSDLNWFKEHIRVRTVGKVTRVEILHLLGQGRELGLSQASINRRVMVGLMALRNAGAELRLKKGDWPKIPETDVTIYTPEELEGFFAACNPTEKLIFQTFLLTGFRMREVSTLTWADVDEQRKTLRVRKRPEYKFTPKSHETRDVVVPGVLISHLKQHRKKVKRALVFPTPPHPKRPNYGGDKPDAHHLELCKRIAYRAGLNCGFCDLSTVDKNGKKVKRHCADGPYCENWFLHKWRHTYATRMLKDRRMDIKDLQVVLGHKNLATTEIYLKALRVEALQPMIEHSSLVAYL